MMQVSIIDSAIVRYTGLEYRKALKDPTNNRSKLGCRYSRRLA